MAERRVVNGQSLGPLQLYVFGEPRQGIVKIGVSGHPAGRLKLLKGGSDRTLCPEGIDRSKLVLLHQQPGGRRLELRLHRQFASRRVIGEWFDLGPVAASLVRSAAADTGPEVREPTAWKRRRRSPLIVDHRAAAARLAAEFASQIPERRRPAPPASAPTPVSAPVPVCAPRLLVYRLP